MHLDETQPSGDDIRVIPFHKYIPRPDEQASLKADMKVMIERICATNIPYFKDLEKDIVWCIQHAHSTELSAKSIIVCLYYNKFMKY